MVWEKVKQFYLKTYSVHILFGLFIFIYLHYNPFTMNINLKDLGIDQNQILQVLLGGGDVNYLLGDLLHKTIYVLGLKLLKFLILVDLPTQISFYIFLTVVLGNLESFFVSNVFTPKFKWKEFFWFFTIYISILVLLELAIVIPFIWELKTLFGKNIDATNVMAIISSMAKLFDYFKRLENWIPYILMLFLYFFLIFPPLIQKMNGKEELWQKVLIFLKKRRLENLLNTVILSGILYFLLKSSSIFFLNIFFIILFLLGFEFIMWRYMQFIEEEAK